MLALAALQVNVHVTVLKVVTHCSGQVVVFHFILTQPKYKLIFNF